MAGPLDMVYQVMGTNPYTRRMMRSCAREFRSRMHITNAYADMLAICRGRPPAAILDVGAYIGQTVLKFADEFKGIPIHAFEPTPDTFKRLETRVAAQPMVSVHQIALSDQNGSHRFFCNGSPQANSLLDNAQANTEAFPDATAHLGAVDVETRTLDSWMPDHIPSGDLLMKVDVQGAEGLLLDGGKKTLAERVTAFFCETAIAPLYEGEPDFFSLHSRLTLEFGLVLAQIYPCTRDKYGKALYTDALWIHPSRLRSDNNTCG